MADDRPLRMDAYYYSFDPTGVEMVDRVLSAVACAGKAYHHTESWCESIEIPYERVHRGGCAVDWIQNAANDAAEALAAAEQRAERAEADLRYCRESHSLLDRKLSAVEAERDAALAIVKGIKSILDETCRKRDAFTRAVADAVDPDECRNPKLPRQDDVLAAVRWHMDQRDAALAQLRELRSLLEQDRSAIDIRDEALRLLRDRMGNHA